MSKHRSRDGKIYPNLHDATVANRAHDTIVRLRTESRRVELPVFITEEHDFGYAIEPLRPGESVAVRQGAGEVTIFSYEDIGERLEQIAIISEGQEVVLKHQNGDFPCGVCERGEAVAVFAMETVVDEVLDYAVKEYVMADYTLLNSVESGATTLVLITKER